MGCFLSINSQTTMWMSSMGKKLGYGAHNKKQKIMDQANAKHAQNDNPDHEIQISELMEEQGAERNDSSYSLMFALAGILLTILMIICFAPTITSPSQTPQMVSDPPAQPESGTPAPKNEQDVTSTMLGKPEKA